MGSNIDVASTGALVNRLMNPPNPMEQLGQTIQGVNALKSFQANQASADAYRQSVDPTTGAFDQGKFNALVSQSPGAWNMGETMRSAGTGYGAQSQATTANVQSTMAQLGATAQFLYPLLQKATAPGGVVSPQEAQAALDRAHGLGLINNQVYQRTAEQIRQIPPGGNANSIVIGASIGNEGAMHALGGNIQYHDVGGAQVPAQTFPLGYGFGAGPQVLPKGPTPGEVIQQQQWLSQPFGQNGTYYDKNGQAKVGSVSQWMHDYNVPYDAVHFGPGGVATAPGAPSFQLTAPAATPAASAAPGPAPAPAQAPQPQRGGTTVLPASQIQGGQEAYKQAQTDAANMADRMAPLRSALGLLRTNADLQTGPGQQQYAQAITGIAAALNLKVPQGSTDLQELTKFLAQNIRAQQTGGTTDLGRLETEASNPNPNTQSRDALQVLLAKTLGTTRLQNAAFDYFNAKYGGPETAATNSGRYTLETSTWKKNQDPTAYAIDELAPEQVQRYFTGLSGTFDPKTGRATGAKAQFVQSMRDAKRLYNLQPGTATTAPAAAPIPAPTPTQTPAPAPPPPASSPTPGYLTPQQMYGGG